MKKLGDLCEVVGGGTPSKKNNRFFQGSILWATVRDMKSEIISDTEFKITKEAVKNSSTNIIPKGNVIIATRVGLGKVCFLTKDTAINQDLRGIIPKRPNQIDVRFLFQWFKSIAHLIVSEGTGATVQGVKLPFIKDLRIPVPSLSEQQRIVSILDESFAAIDKAKSYAEKNLQNARELFEAYLQQTFEDAAKTSKMISIGELCKLTRGHNPPKSKFVYEPRKGYVRFYQIRDGSSDDYVVYVPDSSKLHKVETDELLVVAYRHIGRVFRGVSGAFNVALCKVTNRDKSRLDDDYLFHIIPTDFVRGELLKRSERSLIPSMSVDHLKEIKIPVPTLHEQKRMVCRLGCLRVEVQKLEALYNKKVGCLEELKKAILTKAFSGELESGKALTRELML